MECLGQISDTEDKLCVSKLAIYQPLSHSDLYKVHSFGLSSLHRFHFPTDDRANSIPVISWIVEGIPSSVSVGCHLSTGIRASIVRRKPLILIDNAWLSTPNFSLVPDPVSLVARCQR